MIRNQTVKHHDANLPHHQYSWIRELVVIQPANLILTGFIKPSLRHRGRWYRGNNTYRY